MIEALKFIHVTCVVISGVLFLYRGFVSLYTNMNLQKFWRVLPHINDSILLVSAVALALQLQQYPLTHGWLTAKVIALIVYIGLGMVALKPRLLLPVRHISWIAAFLVYIYIIMVALNHNPFPYLT